MIRGARLAPILAQKPTSALWQQAATQLCACSGRALALLPAPLYGGSFMNIVDTIKDYLSNEVISRISSSLGVSEETVRSAVNAAVPGLLGSLAGVASTSDGARKVASALGGLQAQSDTARASVQPGQLGEQGTSLLNSLFGGNILGNIVNVLAGNTGMGAGMMKNLLGMLAPIVMGAIAKKFAGQRISPESVTGFFNEQRSNIAHAMPAGLSMANLMPAATPTPPSYREPATTGSRSEPPSFVKWLLPLAALAALLLVLWWGFNRPARTPGPRETPSTERQTPAVAPARQPTPPPRAAVADATTLSKDLGGVYQSLTDTLDQVTDKASAEKALPALQNISAKIDTLKSYWNQLPAEQRTAVRNVTQEHLGKLKDEVSREVDLPGVGDMLKPTLDNIVSKLDELGE
jgi:hypothetical protein